jgi:hypothetical protein
MMEKSEPTQIDSLKTLLKSLDCRIISTLAVTVIVALIVAVVLVRQSATPNSKTTPAPSASNTFLAEAQAITLH